MKAHPIIFSGPMVRALLDGRKTQTRRLATSPLRRVEPGDTLWVRENFWPWTGSASGKTIVYQADAQWIDWGSGEQFVNKAQWVTPVRPSIHMPRWASRLTLKVTDVRVEQLQEISADDVLAEGCPVDPDYRDTSQDGSNPHMVNFGIAQWRSPRAWYHLLWDALHPEELWDANPDVVALTFTVEHVCPAKA